ncbi:hypothetical protein PHLGIDRAFT_199838 [Phlebiopsis gigantea 11061_1 CR5-6]|uniref:Uncharacterized protein n=1 Tax=Phlebiopsis gigantea (strain 11061_1 CR5-6) TaxID=745531 RepID=A0A0C3RU20_PHLG1|nr:hypothetical protein PHLGIDRAFT_199838 [Phlebiopsis gigantea 11061_1 CR5-6]
MTADLMSPPSNSLVAEAAPRFLACLLNWGLYGALSVQVYWYYIAFPNDRWFPKTLVYSVYALDTAQTIIVTNDVFNVYAKNFGNTVMLDSIGTEWLAVPILTSIVSCTVQMYYGFRLKILSRSRVLMAVVYVVCAPLFCAS